MLIADLRIKIFFSRAGPVSEILNRPDPGPEILNRPGLDPMTYNLEPGPKVLISRSWVRVQKFLDPMTSSRHCFAIETY